MNIRSSTWNIETPQKWYFSALVLANDEKWYFFRSTDGGWSVDATGLKKLGLEIVKI
jgi:hypothetical protein